MNFPVSETYGLPMNAKSLVAAVMAMVEASSQRLLNDKAFSVAMNACVRLVRMSHHLHRLLRKMLGVVPGVIEGRTEVRSEEKNS